MSVLSDGRQGNPLPSTTAVYIGIFARNEAEHIGQLLEDLSRQTLLSAPGVTLGLAVVANGCSDATADVSRERLQCEPFSRLKWGAWVHELERPGKSNAWNEFVHSIVPPETDFVFFLDADIRIPDAHALKLVVDSLVRSTNAIVAVDRSMKDLELQKAKGLSEWLIKAATGTANDTRTAIAGAFYCVRYSEVAPIWLPVGLPGEDGFLRAMLLTSSFAHPERLERHLYVGEVYHVFESIRDARGVVRHNIRLAIGTAINILLFGHLRQIRASGADIASYIANRNQADPNWVNELVKERIKSSYFPLELRFLVRRFRERKSFASPRRLAIAVFGTMFDLVVFLKATHLMRQGAGAGYW